ncbi:MAG: peptidoglycan DD-metalloendopeptidase family protein [Henriciella sp.]|uniref:peptidoglycan DD-metalloendopeptidase family protein n=1 Tax=Henriciella sp. TaxID=1968823 RepID=UPI0032EE4A3D
METQIGPALTTYRHWLATRTTSPLEPIRGLSSARHLPLDRKGLDARGWSDLPLDWEPGAGEIHAGGYGEDRAIYDTPIFNPPGKEPRTIHLGLDVFAAAGTPVFAPLDGRVHSVQHNDNAKDYGPTVILEHQPVEGLQVWTLYGHLARDVLQTLQAGDRVSTGQQIASLGANDVNGGWAPHLHFQIMLDLQGRTGDFPGVANRSEAADWLTLCPDPGEFLGLASA